MRSGIGVIASAHVDAATGIDVLAEPFDNLASWTVVGAATVTAGRNGNGCTIAGAPASNHLDYLLAADKQYDTITIGFAWKTTTTSATSRDILALYSDSNATRHARLVYNGTTNQSFSVARDATSLGTSATGLVPVNTWCYLEVKWKLGDSPNGSVVVRLNGVEILNVAGVDTRNAGTKAVYDAVRLQAATGMTNVYDDLYIAVNNAPFKGDTVVPSGLVLTMGAFGFGNSVSGDQPPRSLTLPNWPVTAGELLLVGLGGCCSNEIQGDPYWLLSGGGLTWTRVEARRSTAYVSSSAIFWAVATTTTTITNLLAQTSTKGLQVDYALAKVTGFNASTPIGATAGVADDSADGPKDITLSATPAASSRIFAVAFVNSEHEATGKGIDHGASAGWSEAFQFGPAGTGGDPNGGDWPWGTFEGQTKTGHTSTTVHWDDLKTAGQSHGTYNFAGCAIEIKAA